jgi:hypothetical protein
MERKRGKIAEFNADSGTEQYVIQWFFRSFTRTQKVPVLLLLDAYNAWQCYSAMAKESAISSKMNLILNLAVLLVIPLCNLAREMIVPQRRELKYPTTQHKGRSSILTCV